MTKNFLIKNVIKSMDDKSKGTVLRAMAIFIAIDLCGTILRGSSRYPKKNFRKFCQSKYMPSKYSRFWKILYSIFRNSVVHNYRPRRGALLTSDSKSSSMHLKCYKQGLCVYIPKLAEDVQNAVKKFYVAIKENKQLKKNYKLVIQELDQKGIRDYNNFLKKNNVNPKTGKFKRDIYTKLT